MTQLLRFIFIVAKYMNSHIYRARTERRGETMDKRSKLKRYAFDIANIEKLRRNVSDIENIKKLQRNRQRNNEIEQFLFSYLQSVNLPMGHRSQHSFLNGYRYNIGRNEAVGRRKEKIHFAPFRYFDGAGKEEEIQRIRMQRLCRETINKERERSEQLLLDQKKEFEQTIKRQTKQIQRLRKKEDSMDQAKLENERRALELEQQAKDIEDAQKELRWNNQRLQSKEEQSERQRTEIKDLEAELTAKCLEFRRIEKDWKRKEERMKVELAAATKKTEEQMKTADMKTKIKLLGLKERDKVIERMQRQIDVVSAENKELVEREKDFDDLEENLKAKRLTLSDLELRLRKKEDVMKAKLESMQTAVHSVGEERDSWPERLRTVGAGNAWMTLNALSLKSDLVEEMLGFRDREIAGKEQETKEKDKVIMTLRQI